MAAELRKDEEAAVELRDASRVRLERSVAAYRAAAEAEVAEAHALTAEAEARGAEVEAMWEERGVELEAARQEAARQEAARQEAEAARQEAARQEAAARRDAARLQAAREQASRRAAGAQHREPQMSVAQQLAAGPQLSEAQRQALGRKEQLQWTREQQLASAHGTWEQDLPPQSPSDPLSPPGRLSSGGGLGSGPSSSTPSSTLAADEQLAHRLASGQQTMQEDEDLQLARQLHSIELERLNGGATARAIDPQPAGAPVSSRNAVIVIDGMNVMRNKGVIDTAYHGEAGRAYDALRAADLTLANQKVAHAVALVAAIEHIRKAGFDALAFVPDWVIDGGRANNRHAFGHQLLQQYIDTGVLSTTPARCDDDKFVLKYAMAQQFRSGRHHYVLTNDNFRDHVANGKVTKAWVDSSVLKFSFVHPPGEQRNALLVVLPDEGEHQLDGL